MNHAVVSLGIVTSVLVLSATALLIAEKNVAGTIFMILGSFNSLSLVSMIVSTGIGSSKRS